MAKDEPLGVYAALGGPGRQRRLIGAAFASFVAIFIFRFIDSEPLDGITLLYTVPISLLAIERGIAWGIPAAALALGLIGLWDLTSGIGEFDWRGYATRGTAFFLVGGLVGYLSDQIRRIATDSTRHFELSADPICTARLDGYFERLNPAWERLLGWSREELTGRQFMEFVHPDDREATEERMKVLAEGKEVLGFENRYRCKDGGYRSLLWSASAVPEEGRIFAVTKDITARRRAQEEALAARREAERANQAKSEFLSRMSHELRTPLNSILGFAQLLEMDGIDQAQRESVEQITKGGRHLLELINEVLDISRIDTGTMTMSLEPVHLGSVLAEVVSLIAPLAKSSEVRIDADSSRLEEWYVLADQQRLRQIVINLLSNAVKYNRRAGQVRVSAERLSEGRTRLHVADTGTGMSAEQLERLFNPFERLGAERTQVEGTGLGLALSKRLAEAMGGTITAESEPGSGTTITVELESAESPPPPESPVETDEDREVAGEGQRTVLYIEDNRANLRLAETALKRLPGTKLISAMHGELGLEFARQHRPDLVLLDLHLPDLDGREVLAELQRDPATADIPVVVLSADATPGQIERLLAAGASDYLTKPFDLQRLIDLVAAVPERQAG